MKIHNLILILPLVFILNNINAQEVIIGKDSVEVEGLPFYDGDYYSYSQTIYNQKYINAIGDITKISYYYNGEDTYSDNVSIYMGHTEKSAFSGDDYIPIDSLTLVYDGTFSATTEGWAEIELDLSFSYNNIDNLVIAFDDNTRNYHVGDFYCTALDDENYKSIFYRSYDDLNPADMSYGYETKYIPNIKIEGSLTITDHFHVLGDTNRQISTDYNSTVIYNIATNASDFTVTCSATWLDLNYDTGAKTVSLISNSPVNTVSESRTANIIISSDGFDDINANVTQYLFEETQIDLPEILAGSIEFGDYDRDGDMDFLYTQSYYGYPEIYENSLNIFNTINAELIEASYGDATWGDYDNDGDLDFAIAGKDGSGNLNTKIYQNKGNSVFDTIPANLMGLHNGSLDWGDYDNDGDLDLLVTGADASYMAHSILYRNDGSNIFTDSEINIPACRSGSVEWGDYNNDNILDILMSGVDINGNRITTILKNNGPGSSEFTDIQAGLKGLSNNSVSWGDYDLDGDLDILISGDYYEYSSLKHFSAVYRNDGNDIFTNIKAGLINISGKGAIWGDYDNDGDLDIFLAGYHWSSDSYFDAFKIYQNQGNDLFIETNALSTEFSINKITLGDYDGDSDLDILCSGSTTENSFIKIYRNNINIVNTEPEMPDGLSTTVQDDNVILSWNPSTDAETHSKGLTYNIGFGTENDSFNIVSPMVDTLTGYRKSIPAMGNAMLDTNYLLTELDTGMYYWTVQSVDNGFLSSDFHEIDSFIVVPTFTDSEISLQKGSASSVAWGDYDNDGDLDIAIIVVDQETVNEYSKIYRNDGNNNFVDIVANIMDIFYGAVNWGDYDNDGDLDLAITGRQGYISDTIISTIYRNDGNDNFEDIGAQLTGMYDGFVEWGDLDNDGDLDLLLGGFPQLSADSGSVTIVYRNDGNGIFTEIETDIPGVGRSFADISDYDNDGDMDIIISGKTGTFPLFTFITKIYRNDDNFKFTDINAGLTGVNDGSVEWGDYDNDGHLDILITGYDDASNKILKIYHNDGNDSFTEIYINTRGVATGNATWGDYDNDGFLDILVAGYSGNYITKIYRNNRNGDFNEIITSIPGVANSSVAWGNYDNDSDLDIIISGGWGPTFRCTKIFNNNTNYPNDRPSFPTNLQTENWGYGIKLMWDKASDNQGEENGLSYNVRIGATSNGIEIMSPASRIDSTYNLIPKMGNVQTNTSWRIDSLAIGTYYWSVQAVDQSFVAGEWTEEQTFSITVLRADFTTDTVCHGTETTFTDESLSSGDLILEWKWDFGDGQFSTEQNPTHIFKNSGTHQIKLLVQSAEYSDSITQEVLVKPKPTSNFTADIACQGTSTSFTNNTILNGTTVTDWYWDFGDGESSVLQDSISYGYLNPGDYNVRLAAYANNGCADSIQSIVTVAEYPVAAITASSPYEFCSGDSVILSVEYDENYLYTWKIGTGNITDADSSKYTAKISGAYSVEVVNSTGNCTTLSTDADVIVLDAPVPPYISVDGAFIFCQGDSVVLSVTEISDYSYQWKLNGGAVGEDSYEYIAKNSGTYTLTVTNANGCEENSSNSIDVTVNPKPVIPTVSINGNTSFCQGNSVELSVADNPDYSYQWTNNGNNITGENSNIYTATTSGTYALIISNSSGCSGNTEDVPVTVLPSPTAPNITVDGLTEFCDGDSVVLSVTENPDYTYQWKLNGGAVGEDSYEYIAKNSGTYTLTVTNASGCEENSSNNIDVMVNASPEISAVNLSGATEFCEGGSLTMSIDQNDSYTYQWRDEYGIITGETTNSYTTTETGIYILDISNSSACVVQTTPVNVSVKPMPVTPVLQSDNYVPGECLGTDPVRLYPDQASASYSYQWLRNGIQIINATESFLEDYLSEGDYSLIADMDGCTAESSVLNLDFKDAPAKPNLYVKGPVVWYMAASDNAAAQYKWYHNGTLIPDADKFIYVANQTLGSYKVAIANDLGCFTMSDEVTIPTTKSLMTDFFVPEQFRLDEDIDPFANLKIYPNPTPGMFTIEMDNYLIGELDIRIYSSEGRQILNIKFEKTTEHFQSQIDLSGQGEGVYLINFLLDKYFANRKIVVE